MKKTKLIILGGFAGSGKTAIARKLASEFNYPIFSSDEINDGLRPLLSKDFHNTSPVAYGLLWFLLKRHLRNNVTSILDSNMCNDQSWKAIDEIKSEFREVDVLPIILKCSLDVHKERIFKREVTDKEHLNLGGDKLDDVMHKYEYINKLNRSGLIQVDANRPINKVYKEILNIIITRQR